jgi:hypothetical protein
MYRITAGDINMARHREIGRNSRMKETLKPAYCAAQLMRASLTAVDFHIFPPQKSLQIAISPTKVRF